MILYLLISSALAQSYQTAPNGYAYTSAADAHEACVGIGMQLCTAEQLFTVVFGSLEDGQPDLCWNGWTSDFGDYATGWFNNVPDSCGQVGWNVWVDPSGNYGAHCCAESVPETTISHCGDFTCSAGKIPVDYPSDTFCPTGACDEDTCCVSWSAAERYEVYPNQWAYVYDTPEQAEAACTALHEDYNLCTEQQLEGLGMDGEAICSAGWYKTNDGYERGWYVGADYAATGECGAEGWSTWAPADGKGSAHCCAPSYHKSYYGHLADGGFETSLSGAIDYCATTTYTTAVCNIGQLETIAKVENNNICTSGIYREGDIERIGWWQGIGEDEAGNVVCNGITGLRSWASTIPVAHCCAEYVMEPDLGIFTYEPRFYPGFVDGASAEAECTGMGYDQLCTKGQVVWIGTHEQPDLCVSGWSKDGGNYVHGWYHTAADPVGCGSAGSWNDDYKPAAPVAFCCMASVEEITLTQNAYYNGNWDYSYTTQESAAAMCTGDYSLCSEAQVYTIAAFGVQLDDGTTQQETNICRLGWTSDGTKGWWQYDDSQCDGLTGWRTFNSDAATYHCCLNFEAEEIPSGTDEPTAAPTETIVYAWEQISSGQDYASMAEAKQACEDYHPQFSLCSAAQIVEVALNGAPGDGTFLPVEAQLNICHTVWVDTDKAVCEEPKDIGWYRVNSGCGSSGNSWETWHPTSPDLAGAFCCGPSVVVTIDARDELNCMPEEEEEPTSNPTALVITEYTAITDEMCTALNIDDCTRVFTKDGEYYVYDGIDTYYPTCVAYSPVDDASCDYLNFVCGACLGTTYGTFADQGKILAQAMAESNFMHASCPLDGCFSYTGYSPSGFEDKVEYTYCQDGCYYMNGMSTCVCEDSVDVGADLANLWNDKFELSYCEDPRQFDLLMTDQIWITNHMIDNLESQIQDIPDVQTQLNSAQAELKTIWGTWETEITQTINSAIEVARADGDDTLCDRLDDILVQLEELGSA